MALLSDKDRRLISAVIAAFRPADCPITVEEACARAVGFLETLARRGSSRIAEIQRLLRLLRLTLLFVSLSDREAVRRRLTAMERGAFPFLIARSGIRALARFAQRLATMVLYSTPASAGPLAGRPTAAYALGYRIYEDRVPSPPVVPREPILDGELFVPAGSAVPDRTFDVVVVGSGAAGSVVVRRLVEAGLDVALVESGEYVPESEGGAPGHPVAKLRPPAHDELMNLVAYYKDGGLQLTRREIPMFVFQGECLGGTSVVNNAVCFRLPPHVRARWANDHGAAWAVDGQLDRAYEVIATELGIRPADQVASLLNPSANYLRRGAVGLVPCDVNLSHDPKCLGCGYCNLTCAYLRKRSVLQVMLPAAARSVRQGRGRLTILTGRKALAADMDVPSLRATGVFIRPRAEPGARPERLAARAVVLCAGAVASSGVLGRTSALRSARLPIGKRFSFNFGSPVHADYDEPVRAFEGLQIAHYDSSALEGSGFVIETWFNPPATQSLALPGWMDDLDANLRRYAHLACAAPLIGSGTDSEIVVGGSDDPEEIRTRLGPEDLQRLKAGLSRTCELFFASDPGPRRVLLGTYDDWSVAPTSYGERVGSIERFGQVQIGTGHPQGGNCLDARRNPGVVDPRFHVHGTRALFVVDASVFPTSAAVNPHWTVMALAELFAGNLVTGAGHI